MIDKALQNVPLPIKIIVQKEREKPKERNRRGTFFSSVNVSLCLSLNACLTSSFSGWADQVQAALSVEVPLSDHNADVRAPLKVTLSVALWCTVFDEGRSALESTATTSICPPYFLPTVFHLQFDPHLLAAGAPVFTADTWRTGSSIIIRALYLLIYSPCCIPTCDCLCCIVKVRLVQ